MFGCFLLVGCFFLGARCLLFGVLLGRYVWCVVSSVLGCWRRLCLFGALWVLLCAVGVLFDWCACVTFFVWW